jgi:putative aldouronate transport system permease protein
MHIRESAGRKVFNFFNIVIMCLLIIATLYPMIYVVLASFSNSHLLMAHDGILLRPAGFSLAAYKGVFSNPNILTGYRNTLFILVVGTTTNIVLTSLGAYVLSRKNVLFNNVIMMVIMFTMFFSGGMIPTYLLVKNLGLTDTFFALFLPNAISTYNMIIMRTGFAAIPESLEESAKIDGASHLTILIKIVFPLAKATVAVIVLYYGVAHWNAWFNAMIYLPRKRELRPLQLILRGILIENDTNSMMEGGSNIGDVESIAETIKYAVIVVATLPILSIYPFLQKYFIKGVMIGAVKG